MTDPTAPQLCPEIAEVLHPRLGIYRKCALLPGHEGPCLPGGECEAHGPYVGFVCPKWPACIKDGMAKMLATPCRTCGETADSTPCLMSEEFGRPHTPMTHGVPKAALPQLDVTEEDWDKSYGHEAGDVKDFPSFHCRERQLLNALGRAERAEAEVSRLQGLLAQQDATQESK